MHAFNSIFVVQSLATDEAQTGRRLASDLADIVHQRQLALGVTFMEPSTARQFVAALAEIGERAAVGGAIPILHLEAHGDEGGLVLASGEHVTWPDLREVLININRACGLNMLVVVAACNGAYLIKTATQLDGAPFWGVVGAQEPITVGQVQDGFKAFYRILLETLNGDEAMRGLNAAIGLGPHLTLITAEALFLRAYAQYLRNYASGKGKKRRVEELVTIARRDPSVVARGLKWLRRRIRSALATQEEERGFARVKARFFFETECPANRQRFQVTFEQARALAGIKM